ncbi:MAG: flagellar motor switch protein FliG [Candidatus Eremiobacterota bacterium]
MAGGKSATAADDMSGARKAAVLLLTLGVDATLEVTRHLEQSLVYDVLRQVSKISAVDPDVSRAVLSEFVERLPLVSEAPSGKNFVSEVMKRSAWDDDPLTSIDFLRRLDKGQLLDIVRTEHPQVVAFILSYVNPEQAALLMAELPPDMQVEIATRIATSEPPQRETLAHLARSLGTRLSFFGSEGVSADATGLEALVRIMKGVGREVEQNILTGFGESRPELAEELKKNMFVFDDLSLLDQKSLQRVLKDVDGKSLALALKRASPQIVELVKANMSERARKILEEDMAALGKVRVKDVDKAQSDIVSVVRRLEETGEITVGREDEAYV